MIKKSVFEDEIVANMQQELEPLVKQASANITSAIDYLNNAAEIFEEAGLVIQADQIVQILYKLATSKVQKLPALNVLFDAGITVEDFQDFNDNSVFAKAKINRALLDAGYNRHQIGEFIGQNNVMTDEQITEYMGPKSKRLTNLLQMIKDPTKPVGNILHPNEEVEISSIASSKPRDPRTISDPHTKGLTPDKMVKNLLHHGTEFNMADDGSANDLLNLEVGDHDLEVSEKSHDSEMGFEDEI